jgi:hypothetical protein
MCIQCIDIFPVLDEIRYLSGEVVVLNSAALREVMKIRSIIKTIFFFNLVISKHDKNLKLTNFAV